MESHLEVNICSRRIHLTVQSLPRPARGVIHVRDHLAGSKPARARRRLKLAERDLEGAAVQRNSRLTRLVTHVVIAVVDPALRRVLTCSWRLRGDRH